MCCPAACVASEYSIWQDQLRNEEKAGRGLRRTAAVPGTNSKKTGFAEDPHGNLL